MVRVIAQEGESMSATASQTVPAFVDRAPVELPHPVRMRVLGAVMIGVFLAALDQTVVGTALPRIITDLGGNSLYTWAFTAYLLTSTISGPLYGKLSDLFGRRPIFLFGIGVFMVGSLLAGLSQEMWRLFAPLAVQGPGAGGVAACRSPWRPGPRRGCALPDRAGGHRGPVRPVRAWQVPGPVRGGLRAVRPGRPGDRRDHHR